MQSFDRIAMIPNVVQGQPCVKGTRITVRRVLDMCATYPNRKELFHDFPELTEEDIRQCLAFAAQNLATEIIDLPVAS